MALTLDQLLAQRDAIIQDMNAPARTRGADGREVQHRPVEELKSALAIIDAEILKASGNTTNRVSFAQHKRGDGYSGSSDRGGCR